MRSLRKGETWDPVSKQGSPSTETGDKVTGRDVATGVRGDAQVGA